MQYVVKSFQKGSITDNGNGTSTMQIIVAPGIAGDKYGFTSGNIQINCTSFEFPNKGADFDQIDKLAQEAAEEFVKKTYPDTK